MILHCPLRGWMKYVALCLLAVLALRASAADNLIPNPQFTVPADRHSPAEWKVWSPRAELSPSTGVEGSMLSLGTKRFEEYGAWTASVQPIRAGRYYRFQVLHRAQNVASEEVSVAVILAWWKNGEGKGEIQRDYVEPIGDADESGWRTSARTIRAPEGARGVSVELVLRWAAGGSVQFKSPSLVETQAPASRVARIITTHIDPARPASVEGNTRLMAEMLDKVADQHPDLVLFSENFVDRGVIVPFPQKTQPIPGPLTEMLSAKAREYHTYVATTLHELDGGLVYNTAVLIDRAGRIAGKYRKVHVAMAESEGGITPGNEYPVFQTDFAKVGILTCWDNWFSEPARILRLKGAEILLFPLAGDGVPGHYEPITRARAMDNGLYLVASPTLNDIPALILNPAGETMARATGPFSFAVADLDLNQEWRVRYLSVANGEGEAKSLYIKERRPDTYSDLTGQKPSSAK
jgi:predicted amidohydrolase